MLPSLEMAVTVAPLTGAFDGLLTIPTRLPRASAGAVALASWARALGTPAVIEANARSIESRKVDFFVFMIVSLLLGEPWKATLRVRICFWRLRAAWLRGAP